MIARRERHGRAALHDLAREARRLALVRVLAKELHELLVRRLVEQLRRALPRVGRPCACRAARPRGRRSRATDRRAGGTRRRGRGARRRTARREAPSMPSISAKLPRKGRNLPGALVLRELSRAPRRSRADRGRSRPRSRPGSSSSCECPPPPSVPSSTVCAPASSAATSAASTGMWYASGASEIMGGFYHPERSLRFMHAARNTKGPPRRRALRVRRHSTCLAWHPLLAELLHLALTAGRYCSSAESSCCAVFGSIEPPAAMLICAVRNDDSASLARSHVLAVLILADRGVADFERRHAEHELGGWRRARCCRTRRESFRRAGNPALGSDSAQHSRPCTPCFRARAGTARPSLCPRRRPPPASTWRSRCQADSDRSAPGRCAG